MRPHQRAGLVGLALLAAVCWLFDVEANAADGDIRYAPRPAGEAIADVRCDADNGIGQIKSLADSNVTYPPCAGSLYVTKWYGPSPGSETFTFPTAALQPLFDPTGGAGGHPAMVFLPGVKLHND